MSLFGRLAAEHFKHKGRLVVLRGCPEYSPRLEVCAVWSILWTMTLAEEGAEGRFLH